MQARVKTATHDEGDEGGEGDEGDEGGEGDEADEGGEGGEKRKNVFIFSSYFIFRFSSKQRFSRLLMYFTCSTIPEENLGLLIVYGMKNLRINEEELAGA